MVRGGERLSCFEWVYGTCLVVRGHGVSLVFLYIDVVEGEGRNL